MRTVRKAAFIVTALVFSLAGCSSGTSTPEQSQVDVPASGVSSGTESPAPTPQPTVAIDAELLCHAQIGAETSVTGTTVIEHPSWGKTTIIVCGPSGSITEDAGVLAVDNTGSVKWSTASKDNHVTYELADPATDASGNIFIVYNPGRYDGVMIMRPTNDSIEVLATSYSSYIEQATPLYFYSATLIGPGPDGLYQIEQASNDCNPNCAAGTTTYTTFAWDGITYVEQ